MDLNQIKIEDLLDRYTSLPDELIDILENPNTNHIVEIICKKNNILNPEWIETIKQLTGMVLMGFIHYYDLGSEINLALNFHDSRLGNEIANEITSKIFDPIKSLIEKNYSPLSNISSEPDFIDDLIQKLKEVSENSKNNIETLNSMTSPPPIPIAFKAEIVKETKNLTSEGLTPKQEFITKKFIINEVIPEKKLEPESLNQSQELINKKSDNFKTPGSFSAPKTINSFNPESTKPKNSVPPPPPKSFNSVLSPNSSVLNQAPTPVFIHKEEEITPIKSGIENKIPQIKISEVKPPPPPPQKVQIEIGAQLESQKIKVVNYSNFEEKSNNFESKIPKPPTPNLNIPKPPPPKN